MKNIEQITAEHPKLVELVIKQMVLRDSFNIHLNIHWFGKFDFVIKVEPDKILNERLTTYNTYEECLEEGIKWCLLYLKNK